MLAASDGLTYQWYFKNAGDKEFTKAKQTSNVYTTTMNSASKERIVYCEVTDSNGN